MALLKQSVSIRTILPNLVTLLAFASGLSAMRFALDGRFELALTALALAGILDGLDGTVARLLKGTSRFGAELDSLSDVVAFGVAPAVTLYLWGLVPLGRFGWGIAMIFAMATALRLARFNARLDEVDDPKKRMGFFAGVPAPLGCALAVTPIALDLGLEQDWMVEHPHLIAGYLIFVGLMLVSTIATPSLKQVRIKRHMLPPLLMVLGVLVAGLFAKPWLVASLLCALYLLSLPLCAFIYQRRKTKKGW